MANYRRNGPRGRAKRQAEQRRLRLIVFGGTAAVVLIAVLAALLLPRGGWSRMMNISVSGPQGPVMPAGPHQLCFLGR